MPFSKKMVVESGLTMRLSILLVLLSSLTTITQSQTLDCPQVGAPAQCSGGDISSFDIVNCVSSTTGGICHGTQIWTSSGGSLTYSCKSNVGFTDPLACDGLHLKVDSGTTPTALTINCEAQQSCRNAIFEVNGVSSNLTLTCGIDALEPCRNVTVISNGNILVKCHTSTDKSLPTCEGITVRNTGASDKTLVVDCLGSNSCGVSTSGMPITIGHANAQPELVCSSPTIVPKPVCFGAFAFESTSSPGMITCDRSTSTFDASTCEAMSVTGHFGVLCRAENGVIFVRVCWMKF